MHQQYLLVWMGSRARTTDRYLLQRFLHEFSVFDLWYLTGHDSQNAEAMGLSGMCALLCSWANVVAIIIGVIFSTLSLSSFWDHSFSPGSRLARVLKFCMSSSALDFQNSPIISPPLKYMLLRPSLITRLLQTPAVLHVFLIKGKCLNKRTRNYQYWRIRTFAFRNSVYFFKNLII